MCFDTRLQNGELPACVENCPNEALMFGTRRELIREARRRIDEKPDLYVDQIYGEHEAGGTCWLYLSPVPFEELGMNTSIQKTSYPCIDKRISVQRSFRICSGSRTFTGHSAGNEKMTKRMMKMNNEALIVPDNDGKPIWKFLLSELKPKGKIFTPFNIISVPIILLGIVLIVIRFAKGIGSITNLSQEIPWGLWIGFDVVTGVAFAGGAYVITFMVYILNMKKYHSIVRVTVLNGFLAYLFYAGALLLDLGRPWNVINPIIGNNFGVSSVLFLVAWHFLLYMIAQLIEFSPAIAEWLGARRRIHKILSGMTLAAVIFGITLSMLHQSGLGALFLMAKEKIHPLWYSEFIPVMFFVSSIFAGLSMVIFEGSISHKVFFNQISEKNHKAQNGILTGLSKICTGTLFAYFFLQMLVFIHDKHWDLINTPMGYWFLLEMFGFVLVPMILFFYSYRTSNIFLIRLAAILTMLGVILNRLNVTVIGFRWDMPVHYVPSWMEIVVTLTVLFTEIWIFRWVINRMPVLRESPKWVNEESCLTSFATNIL